MFELKATKGNIDLSAFNLSSLIEESNQNARDIASHNEEVVKRFRELVLSYYDELYNITSALDLPYFEIGNNRPSINSLVDKQPRDYKITIYSNGINDSLMFGHGRGYIKISFAAPFESCGRRLSCNFKGVIRVGKNWLEHSSYTEYPLESVSQIIELGQDVIKLHIIDRNIIDSRDQRIEESKLIYYS